MALVMEINWTPSPPATQSDLAFALRHQKERNFNLNRKTGLVNVIGTDVNYWGEGETRVPTQRKPHTS